MAIKLGDTPLAVREAIGFDDAQWHRFYWLTKEEAQKLLRDHPKWATYEDVSTSECAGLLARINETLAKDHIPTITEDVLRWRMTRVIRERRRSQAAGGITGSAQSQPSVGGTQPYDPVRDV
ncbi:hypothetical protein BU26DRAFT_522831 [Trematosphaeria pertusa]|uniref:Uncharacterized protein n=1 Tax=Trematosphaeria pertusa TaxID=390896 RepID=A0A6A6I2C8_9PLEO|nr:uncharacterized protein BU26DRAFT_522831 [Trematosphaeria pertusa]KAF2244122.1 hypothetical protein BU26DRAFT_522831 [Trematosphaeria pertusa]